MSLEIGIIGLPQSGRTTIFNALTKGRADTACRAPEGLAPHIGMTKVPEPRVDTLAEMFQPKKATHAEVKYIDIGASVKELAEDKGISGELLNQLAGVDALINVVRAFSDESVPHTAGSLDVERDIATIELELAFSDMALLERRVQRIAESLKSAKPDERQGLLREQELIAKIKAHLEKELPIRELSLTDAEARAIAGYRFLTAKPLLIAVNIGEDQLPQAAAIEEKLKSHLRPGCDVIALCGELEMELAQLDEDAARQFQEEFGITSSGLDRAIKSSYKLLGLISFLTIGSDEVKAWSIKKGTSAVKAAGKVHSDIEKGFIRAEVVSYDDFMECGKLSEARKKGLLRLEGKDYTVRDGDIINFLFNV